VREARLALYAALVAALALLAWQHAADVRRAVALATRASGAWLAIGALATLAVSLVRGLVFGIALDALGFAVRMRRLWLTAYVASCVDQLLPAGGASGFAYSTSAFTRRGVPTGQASLVALLELVTYGVAVATVFFVASARLAWQGRLPTAGALGVLAPGALLAGAAAWIYCVQRDEARCRGLARRWGERLARLLRRRWTPARLDAFLDQYYRGTAVIDGRVLGRMIGVQYLALLGDVAALYAMFAAVGAHPPLLPLLVGFVLATAGLALVAAPAGGGSFEVILTGYLTLHGIAPAAVIAAALLFRLISFWIPALTCLPLLLRRTRRAAGPAIAD
jgi:uncharacterized protein (TIRG00374 family)